LTNKEQLVLRVTNLFMLGEAAYSAILRSRRAPRGTAGTAGEIACEGLTKKGRRYKMK